jgi:DNA-binding transcriptional ArsR family regulator
MARAATTTDAFNAVAEPRRRQILDVLAGGELSVTDLVARLGLSQPLVSKHLRVLREVGLVHVRDIGRQRLYRLDAGPLRSIAEWLRPFERAMSERFDLMDAVIQELKTSEEADDGDDDAVGEGDPSD